MDTSQQVVVEDQEADARVGVHLQYLLQGVLDRVSQEADHVQWMQEVGHVSHGEQVRGNHQSPQLELQGEGVAPLDSAVTCWCAAQNECDALCALTETQVMGHAKHEQVPYGL